MGNTLRYEGFRNVLLSQMRKRLSGKLGIKQISRREMVKNNDTVMEMLLVELEDGRVAPTLYLEDLYITPDARGHGAGKALLQHLARIAMEKDCGRFEWSCLDWNTPSIKFYDSLGALPQTEWIRYRMTGSALQAMATGDKQA